MGSAHGRAGDLRQNITGNHEMNSTCIQPGKHHVQQTHFLVAVLKWVTSFSKLRWQPYGFIGLGPWSPVSSNPVFVYSTAIVVPRSVWWRPTVMKLRFAHLLIRDCSKIQEKRERESKTEKTCKTSVSVQSLSSILTLTFPS